MNFSSENEEGSNEVTALNKGQQMPGTPFTITNFVEQKYADGARGVGIEVTANCPDCTSWVQTITRKGTGDVFGREYVDKGHTSASQAEHYSEERNPVFSGSNHFSDMPLARKGGSFNAVVWVGTADLETKTFTTHAAFAYGFSVSKSGEFAYTYPKAATKAEQTHSLKTIRTDSHPWTIK